MDHGVSGQEWSNTFAKCSNLRQLSMENTSVLSLLPPALPHLKNLAPEGGIVTIRDIFCIFQLGLSSRVENNDMFKLLVESNKGLDCVSISEYGTNGAHSKKNSPTVRFLKLLGQLLATVPLEVRYICGVLPCRGIVVNIRIGSYYTYQ